MKFIVVRVTES